MPGLVAGAAFLAGTGQLGNAIANGDTRTLDIFHTHTKESVSITYKRSGSYDREGLEKLNWVLRDWRQDSPTRMDPRLFDIVWEVHRSVGSQEPLHVVSAYRAPETNAMLRRRSRAVAKHSQHMLGKAMDFYLPDVSMAKVREIGLRLQRGGVGYYPTAYNPFVHLDAGSVRHWPRMTRDQLTRLFPDGKTVHLPTDGKPMPRYDEAAAEVVANGGTVFAYASAGDGEEPTVAPRRGKSFFAALFGIGEEDEEDFSRPTQGRRTAGRAPSSATAYAPAVAQDDRYAALAPYQAPQTTLPSVRGRAGAAVIRPTPDAAPAATPAPSAPEPAPVAVASLAPVDLPAAPAGRSIDMPLPPNRPVGLLAAASPTAAASEPQMVWKEGPQGVAASAEVPKLPVAAVPLPPTRPGDLPAVSDASKLVAANVPLPPSRPVTLASLAPVALPPMASPAPSAPAEPAPIPANVPLPPDRPLAARPVFAAAPPQAPAPPPAALPADGLDRSGLKMLFASTAIGPGAHPAQKPATIHTTKVKPATPVAAGLTEKPVIAVVQGFRKQGDDLRVDRFSGPSVKAVPAVRFAAVP